VLRPTFLPITSFPGFYRAPYPRQHNLSTDDFHAFEERWGPDHLASDGNSQDAKDLVRAQAQPINQLA